MTSNKAQAAATRSDINKLETRLDALDSKVGGLDSRLTHVERRLEQLEITVDTRFDTMTELLKEFKNEIKDHFDAAVENIEDELKLANRDEIQWLKDKQVDHEQRLSALESSVRN